MEITPDELARIVEDSVRRALNDQVITCSCGLSEDARKEMPHFLGAIKDLGGDNYSAGIEEFRESVKFINKVKRTSMKVTTAIIVSIALSIIGGIGFLISSGIKAFVFMKGGGQ